MDILIFLSEFMVPLTVFYIVGSGILAKRPVFDDFLDGAKEGMHTVADVLPTLIGLMTAVGVLRASGDLEAVSELLKISRRTLPYPCSGNPDHSGEDRIQLCSRWSDP